jgi:hypothetical protein
VAEPAERSVTIEDFDDFGPLPAAAGSAVPFPRMRPSVALEERWRAEVAKANKVGPTDYQFHSPLEVVPSLLEFRSMPAMSWPAEWPELKRRARTYPGNCIGVVGSIGGGKTSFALQVGRANAGDGTPVLWLPAELDEPEILTRVVANMHGVHAMHVRDTWPEDQIIHTLRSINDLWRFIDRHTDLERQMAAIETAIAVAWNVFRVPPFVAIDHLGVLVGSARDERHAMLVLAERFSEMAKRTKSFIMLLLQSSVANQAVLTGRVELDSATEAMGIETGGKAIASACANTIGLSVFKKDDAVYLDAHGLLSKCRHTGLEGKVGLRFTKAGGVWSEYEAGFLPSTPAEVKATQEQDKKAKSPQQRTADQVRGDLNAARSSDAAAIRRMKLLAGIRRASFTGMEVVEMRRIEGMARGAVFWQDVHELERARVIEHVGTNYRAVTRME